MGDEPFKFQNDLVKLYFLGAEFCDIFSTLELEYKEKYKKKSAGSFMKIAFHAAAEYQRETEFVGAEKYRRSTSWGRKKDLQTYT